MPLLLGEVVPVRVPTGSEIDLLGQMESSVFIEKKFLTQSAGSVEYTDCFSSEG